MAVARDTFLTPITVASGDITQAYTTGSGTTLLAVYVYEESTDAVTGVTFNGDALTKLNEGHMCYSAGGTTHTSSIWYINNPDITTGNIVVTRSSGTGHMEMTAASYTGAGTPSVFVYATSGTPGSCSASTSISTSLTTKSAGSWIFAGSRFDNGGTVAGTGSLTKNAQGASGEASITANYDSNGSTGAPGSKTIGSNNAAAGSNWAFAACDIPPSDAPGPIAFDTATTSSFGTSPSWSHTCTGSNRILIVYVGAAADPVVSGITYNSVAMTKFAETTYPGSGHQGFSAWYLINPASGSNTIAVTSSSDCAGAAESYTGAKQSGQPDSFAVNNNSTGTNSLTTATTVVATDCWLIGGATDNQGTGATAGTGTVRRAFTAQGMNIGDSGNAVGTGSQSLNWTMGGNFLFKGITASIAPYVTPTGPANLKSFDGNATANIKSINGNLIANVKSLSGNS